RLHAIVERTAMTKRALVHGDVSPKNILVGPRGPIFLDAECAWYGDPAFDPAFCLNHMLLKGVWRPARALDYLQLFDTLAASYLDGVRWEPRAKIEARIAALLPGLFLARVDGKSPVEYITTDADRDKVRRVARALIADPPATLAAIRAAWAREIASWS
ncbi:MAG: aminoglycoside phosphotransferase family protein, partial [Alphaproteobacteria bacterium]|nr:aminoglycoside phosphotransferase family protein [Alphaproteobacteria bacterium]